MIGVVSSQFLKTIEPVPSRREAKKAETRQALIDAALELFAVEGYDQTGVEVIAERAGVSPRTFFRYFPSKEDVLFFGEYDYIRSFTGVYLAQPPSLSEYDAIVASLLVLAPALSRIKKRILLYEQAVASSPLLRGREQSHHVENHKVITEALARRRELGGPDDDCRLLATVSLALLRHSLDRWLGAPTGDPRRFIETDFASLRQLVSARSKLRS
jgi:AcrR family transcriptional regulator